MGVCVGGRGCWNMRPGRIHLCQFIGVRSARGARSARQDFVAVRVSLLPRAGLTASKSSKEEQATRALMNSFSVCATTGEVPPQLKIAAKIAAGALDGQKVLHFDIPCTPCKPRCVK